MNILLQQLSELLRKEGADLVRVGGVDRMTNRDVIQRLMPNCRSVLCIAFRQLRGSRRGIEEGTTYYQYTTTAVETLEEIIMPMTLQRGCSFLEKNGFLALPQRRNQLVMSEWDSTNPEVDYTEIYRGKAVENQLDFEQTAIDCGLGERGLSGSILTDDFGPCQRWVFLLTDAELPESPLVVPHLCDKCGACLKACPGHAIAIDGTLNRWQCAAYYNGASGKKNPFLPPDAFLNDPERLAVLAGEANLTPERAREILDQIHFYPNIKHAYYASICGKNCDTACYIHLEEKGKLIRSFKTPFRKRPEWALPLEGPGTENLQQEMS